MSLAEVAVLAPSSALSVAEAAREKLQTVRRAAVTRTDRFVWLIVIAVAVVIVLGLMTAWFIYCQQRGGWPAVDMPSFQSGGTWKVYCAK